MSEDLPRIVVIVGLPGSGKGTCTDYMHDTYGWPLVHFGHMVYEEVERRGLDIVQHEKEVRMDMRAKDGKEVLAKHAARKAKTHAGDGAPIVIMDGLYSWSEYKHLLAEFGDNLTMIAVTAPKKLRHERAVARKDAHRPYTLEQLIAREYAEIEEMEKGGPIAYADYTILNDGSVEHMLNQLNAVLTEVKLV
jgi:dephospho-CoA kinase